MTEHLNAMKAAFGRHYPEESRDDLCRVLVALARAMQKPNTAIHLTAPLRVTESVIGRLGMGFDFSILDDHIVYRPEYDWED